MLYKWWVYCCVRSQEGRKERTRVLKILNWKTFLVSGKYISLYADTILDTMKLEEEADQMSIFPVKEMF